MKKPKVIAVCGPTGSGKSALAVGLALRLGGCVISCDAMQIYRGMDVGTGKVTAAETRCVPHRMIDIADPSEPFSLAEYLDRAAGEIERAAEEDYVPILCGGTGLYVDRLLDGTRLSDAPGDGEIRARLETKTNDELFEELRSVDPEAAAQTHKNNRKRVIRALEIYSLTGEKKSAWDARSHEKAQPYDALRILLLPEDRAALYAAIDARVDRMFAAGLEAEARALFAGNPAQTASQAIGYKEFLPYFEKTASLDEVKEKIKQASRNYAKRQLTWFARGKEESVVIDASLPDEDKLASALPAVEKFLKET